MVPPTSISVPSTRPAAPGWRWRLLVVVAVPLALFGLLLSQASALAQRPWSVSLSWVDALGLALDLQLDSLSLLFALLVTGVGSLVTLYSIRYMAEARGSGRYYASLLLFMAAMLGVVMAGNLMVLFVFWELTSISSYLLIGFHHEDTASQESALQALLITGVGGLALLAGGILLYQVYGTFDLAQILSQPELLRGHRYYGWILGLALLAAFTKSAQFPFHIWLPNAMVAPTPVSAYLHSATMVKAGVYLVARLSPLFSGTAPWQMTLLAVGALTMLLGAGRSLVQRDLKAILAYTTISSLGWMVALLGLGTTEASQAALVLLTTHALYKGALFLLAGAIDHETGTRDVGLLGGLWPHARRLAAPALLASVCMAGLPPTLGFVAKEVCYEAGVGWAGGQGIAALFTLSAIVANACGVALAVVLGYRLFFGPAGGPWPRKPHGSSWLLVLPSLVLAAVAWLLGARPGLLDGLVGGAATVVQPAGHADPLGLWHGWTWVLAASVVTVASGGVIYGLWPRLQARAAPARADAVTAGVYGWIVNTGVRATASTVTRTLQNGSLRTYLLVILGTTIVLVGGGVWRSGLVNPSIVVGDELHWAEVVMAGLVVGAALSVVLAQTRVGAITSLGVVGVMVTLFYVRFKAPDLALTQLVIESLTVILLLLVFHFLPPVFRDEAPRRRSVLEIGVAAGAGCLVATLVLVANSVRLAPSVAEYYLAHSLDLAHGRNVVNVILVDFRGFDTLGEITVLTTAALGLYALLTVRRRKRQREE